MKLNPSKCAFGVSACKFWDLWSAKGLVALGRFIARFTDELRPFFLAIRKAGAHGWTDSCQNAFEKIKHCFMQPPILSSPVPKEKFCSIHALAQRAKTYLLRQQGIGRRRNQVFKNRANSLSPAKRCLEAPPLFSTPSQYFAQTRCNRKNAAMGHRIKRVWN
ncbi:hypothetical protein AAG906_017607 [Vitis piasezkii]